jgi:SAM-dependent methyltransferase
MSARSTSFAQHRPPTPVDRLGRWLSTAKMRAWLGDTDGVRAADIGCGYDAALAQQLFPSARELLLVDVAVDPTLRRAGTTVLEGHLPAVLDDVADGSVDAVICNNVVEHLTDRAALLQALHRITAPGGRCVINVPSWRGKACLEFAAFRLGVSPPEEMEDHKIYYDPHDLWPHLVEAGFLPSRIKVRRHKLGLNTIALCRKPAGHD